MAQYLDDDELRAALMMLAARGELPPRTFNPKNPLFLGQEVDLGPEAMQLLGGGGLSLPPAVAQGGQTSLPIPPEYAPELSQRGINTVPDPERAQPGIQFDLSKPSLSSDQQIAEAIGGLLGKTGAFSLPIAQTDATPQESDFQMRRIPPSSSMPPPGILPDITRGMPPPAGSGRFLGLSPLDWLQLIGVAGKDLRVGPASMIREGGGFRPFLPLAIGAQMVQQGRLAEQVGGPAGQAVRAGLPQILPHLLQLQQIEAEKKIRGEELGRSPASIQQPGIQIAGASEPNLAAGPAPQRLPLNQLIAADSEIQAASQDVDTLKRIAQRTRIDKDIDNWRQAQGERRRLIGEKRTEYIQMTKDEREANWRDTAIKAATEHGLTSPQLAEFEFDEKGAKIRLRAPRTIEELQTGAISEQGVTPGDILRKIQNEKFTDAQLLTAQNDMMRRVDDIRQRIQGVGPMGQLLGPLQGDELRAMRMREIAAAEQAQQHADEYASRRKVSPQILYPDLQVPKDRIVMIYQELENKLKRKPTKREVQLGVADYLIGQPSDQGAK